MLRKLSALKNLHSAWLQIKQKGSSGGIDKVHIAEFERDVSNHIHELSTELKTQTWNPKPYLLVEIKKNESEKRKLGLLCIKDKIVQQAIKALIEARFEGLFLGNSYAYRPNKGHSKAVKRTLSEASHKNYNWLLRLDIDNYFDNIDHQILFTRLKGLLNNEPEIIHLIGLCIKMGVVDNSLAWNPSNKGVPQGAVLSPLLSNLYLHAFDQFILTKTKGYVRYADDFVIFCSSKEEAENLLQAAEFFLTERLKLSLNSPKINEIKDGFEFLGISFSKSGLSLSENKRSTIFHKINQIAFNGFQLSKNSTMTLAGIHRYYGKLLPQNILLELDVVLIAKIKELIENIAKQKVGKDKLNTALLSIPYFTQANILNSNAIAEQLTEHYASFKKQLNLSISPPSLEHTKKTINISEKEKILDQKEKKKSNKLEKDISKLPNQTQLINQRKNEYRKLENEGSELIVNSIGAYIGKSTKGIVVKHKGQIINKGSGRALRHITVMSKEISLSGYAIAYCMENKIPIDLFDGRGKHIATIISPTIIEQTHWQKQANMQLEQSSELASLLVFGKIKNQINLIKYYHKYHKTTEESSVLTQTYKSVLPKLEHQVKKVKKIDLSDPAYAQILMGCEATAAQNYWSYVRALIADDDVVFESRTHQGATDLFNSLLNYGYALLYPRIWRALLAAKLNPMQGVLHAPQTSKPTFVYDVIEIFRAQVVERIVISLIQRKLPLSIKHGMLEDETKKLLTQSVFERLNRYEKYRGEERTLVSIIQLQANEIAAFISEENNIYRPYIAKW